MRKRFWIPGVIATLLSFSNSYAIANHQRESGGPVTAALLIFTLIFLSRCLVVAGSAIVRRVRA
jgi:hypothetical protein